MAILNNKNKNLYKPTKIPQLLYPSQYGASRVLVLEFYALYALNIKWQNKKSNIWCEYQTLT